MTRRLPDVELLLIELLDDIDGRTQTPADVASHLPMRAIYKLGGTGVGQFMDKVNVQVSTYAATREQASDFAEVARDALFDAWRNQTRVAAGGIHQVREVVSPFEVRTANQPDGVHRFDATYQVWTRP